MKTSLFFCVTVATVAIKMSAVAAPAANTGTASNAIPQSVFTVPASKSEGCDPFFPNSTRLWGPSEAALNAMSKPSKPTGSECLVLKGLSGAVTNRFAMINGRTMSIGEDAEIVTDCGRLLVHCVDISTNSAIIEVGGERRELHLRSEF